ncbi:hypothetical protein [uncultured Draconibacterium sp.]|uniref:hypothetical protein n=1 Tax=uncultured Draconibacterium sp. TaxID=1573823 RepID=UPI0025E88D3D|nr:hypothetical protein [uncultured Draconibacterium sp.]
MRIELLFSTANEGKYLFKGDDICTAAWAMLDEAVKTYPDKDQYQLLKTELAKQKDRHYWTWKRINCDLKLKPKFAERLKLWDFIHPKAFTSKTNPGKTFIELFERNGSVFMLKTRTWIGTDILRLEFILCHLDKQRHLLTDLYTGKVDF